MTTCDLCGAGVPTEKIMHVHIKDGVKNICKGCATAVKGLV